MKQCHEKKKTKGLGGLDNSDLELEELVNEIPNVKETAKHVETAIDTAQDILIALGACDYC